MLCQHCLEIPRLGTRGVCLLRRTAVFFIFIMIEDNKVACSFSSSSFYLFTPRDGDIICNNNIHRTYSSRCDTAWPPNCLFQVCAPYNVAYSLYGRAVGVSLLSRLYRAL